MQPFRKVQEGWESRVDAEEALMLAQMMDALASLLEEEETRDPLMPPLSTQATNPLQMLFERGKPTTTYQIPEDEQAQPLLKRPQNKSVAETPEADISEDDLLAALDFEPVAARPAPANPFVAAMIHPLSHDDEEAAELRALTLPSLCQRKRAAMLAVSAQLRWAATRGGVIHVLPDTLQVWLTALNDVRLALSGPLSIKDEASSDRIYRLAVMFEQAPDDDGDTARDEMVLASLYTALGVWQESLLTAIGMNPG